MIVTSKKPKQKSYDVVIIGGAMTGSSVAWFLVSNPAFSGSILILEKDPSLEFSGTTRTNSCIRQQFSTKINIQISQFAAKYIKSFQQQMGKDQRVPNVKIENLGYLYLANSKASATILRENKTLQETLGVKTKLLDVKEIIEEYPFFSLSDIVLGSLNTRDEGFFDSSTVLNWWHKKSLEYGVEYVSGEVKKITKQKSKITSITLSDGSEIFTDYLVNAAGTWGNQIASLVDVKIPVEPRKRYSVIFKAKETLQRKLPLTIDPSGFHVRSDGNYYLCGFPPTYDTKVNHTNFSLSANLWEEKIWPKLAKRIPFFENIKIINQWVGHYDFNSFDQNAILGKHPTINNFIFANGFSGHGLQQAPAVGRYLSEIILYDNYRTLDLSELGMERIINKNMLIEKAII